MLPNLSDVLVLMRPHHYIKNLFIVLPLFFALEIYNVQLVQNVVIAFVSFSLICSAVYIFNDCCDIEFDKLHARKKLRPIASGAITKSQGYGLMTFLLISGFSLMAPLSLYGVGILVIYLILNIGYSYSLKHIAILDVTIISIGFLLRIFIGAVVTTIPLSKWIVVMTFLLALFLALAKRRDDVLIYLDSGKKMRKVIDGYNLQFLDTSMAIMASVVIVSYISYTTSPEVIARIDSQYLYLTTFFVILGILRYLQVALVYKNSSSPTKVVLQDRFIQVTLFGWIATFAWILY